MYRVVIEPRHLGDFGAFSICTYESQFPPEEVAKRYQKRCDDIVAQVKRHIDDIGNVAIELDERDQQNDIRHYARKVLENMPGEVSPELQDAINQLEDVMR